jgi:hypothetical protein
MDRLGFILKTLYTKSNGKLKLTIAEAPAERYADYAELMQEEILCDRI